MSIRTRATFLLFLFWDQTEEEVAEKPTQPMEEIMQQSNAQRADTSDESQAGNRPVAKFKHGGIELAVWPNQTESGSMYNTTISNLQGREERGMEAHQQLQPH
jgi:hypothetical protein